MPQTGGSENAPSKKRNKTKKRRDTCFLYATVATVMLPGFTVGTHIGWEYVYALNNDSNILTVPFLYIGAMVGAIIASIVMDRHGRMVCLWSFFWFIYLALLVHCLTSNVIATCIMRVLAGISVGAYYQVVPIYIAEMCYRRHRGVILAALGCFIAIGIVASPNSFTTVTFLAIEFIFGVVYLIMKIFYAPKTPYYDLANYRFYDAMRTLERCRNHECGSEIREISLDIAAYPRDVSNCFSFALAFTDLNADFLHRTVTAVGLLLFSQGMFVSCHLGLNRYYFATANDLVLFMVYMMIVLLAFLCNLFVIDRCGRKILLFSSSIGVTILYLVMFILYCAEYETTSSAIKTVRALLVFGFYLGWDFIPIIYMCEIMPYPIRAPAVSFLLFFYFVAKAVLPLVYFYAQIFLYITVMPLIFFFVALVSVFFCWFIPPETKQLSLCAVQIKMDHDVTILEDSLKLD